MLLFKPEHVKPIDTGLKTQTRRTWKKPRVTDGSFQKAKTQMLSKNYFALLRITESPYQEKLRSISDADAYAEGGYTYQSYIDKFYEIYPKLDREQMAFLWLWVVKFEKVGPGNLPIDSPAFQSIDQRIKMGC
jgi:hypothetical protein